MTFLLIHPGALLAQESVSKAGVASVLRTDDSDNGRPLLLCSAGICGLRKQIIRLVRVLKKGV